MNDDPNYPNWPNVVTIGYTAMAINSVFKPLMAPGGVVTFDGAPFSDAIAWKEYGLFTGGTAGASNGGSILMAPSDLVRWIVPDPGDPWKFDDLLKESMQYATHLDFQQAPDAG